VNRPARLPSAFTLFDTILNLRGRLAGLFRARRATPTRARLTVECMEERLVPTNNPLPGPAIFVGAGVGDAAVVKAYNADAGTLRFSTAVSAFGSSYTGGLRVAAGDFNGDGTPDAIVSAATGTSGTIEILDGRTGTPISGPLGHFTAYSSVAHGGVWVATGDVEGNGGTDLITAAHTAGGLEVKVFRGTDGSVLADFGVSGAAFQHGISLAAGDFTGAGKADVVVGGADGWVRVYNPLSGSTIGGSLGNFQAFGSGYTGGVVSVAADPLAGVANPGATSELAVGSGGGVTAEVKVFSASGTVLRDLTPFGSSFTGGTRVALAYISDPMNPTVPDVVVGTRSGTADQVKVFSGITGDQLTAPLGAYAPFGTTANGVFVAAENDPPSGQVIFTATSDAYHGASVTVTVTLTANNNYQWDYVVTNTAFWGGTSITYFETDFSAASPVGVSGATSSRGWYNPANGNYSTLIWSMIPGAENPIPSGGGTGTFSFITSRREIAPAHINLDSSGGFTFVGPGANLGPAIPPDRAVLNFDCPPADQVPVQPPTPLANPAPTTIKPVRYADGVNLVVAPGLASAGFGAGWGTTLSWSNNVSYSVGTAAGNGWVAAEQPRLYRTGSSVYLVTDATSAYFYDGQGAPDGNGNYATYAPRHFDTTTVAYDGTNDQFVVTTADGTVYRFQGFGSGRPAWEQGVFQSRTDPGGEVTQVTARDAGGAPTEVQSTQTVNGVTSTESYLSVYLGSGDANAGKLASVTLRRQVGGGAWVTVQTVSYEYYGASDSNGNLGDLKRVTLSDGSGSVLDQWYYRYYVGDTYSGSTHIGYRGGLEYALGSDAYARLKASSGGTDAGAEAASNATVSGFADMYFEYDAQMRVTKETASGVGCSACSAGQGTYTYTYTASTNAPGDNAWAMKTVEVLPDGNQNTVYTNAFGNVMVAAYKDTTTGQVWVNYYRYDSSERAVLVAGRSAVTGYSESYADLVNYGGGSSYLSTSAGLITSYTYAATTTATTSTAGDAAGYLKEVDIRQGTGGTIVPQEVYTYVSNTAGGVTVFRVAADTVYRNANGTGGETTSHAYTYLSGTNQVATVTTTLPTVTTAENGSGTANTTAVVYDAFGRPVWTKDANGSIHYAQYDTLTGAVVKTIADVDTTQTSTFTNLPSGWTTPAGGGLQLTTTYVVDGLGRVTKETDPNGEITYTVYDDVDQEVRTYAGWNTATNRPTGPTTVTRRDRANGYTETLTMSAAPAVSGGVPTGAEAISGVQSLTRSYTNAAGQVIETDVYDNLSGLVYSSATAQGSYTDVYYNLSGVTYWTSAALGTAGVNYDRTQYQYDADGNLCRTLDQLGTITRTVYDGQGRKVSMWVGTNDTPATGYWSPTNNTGTSNMVQVTAYQYDNGGVGDGNLTAVTQYPGGAAAAEVTQTWYDWRDRAVAQKSGVQSSEASGVNRPLVVYTYDNRNEVIETQVYAADGLAPTIVGGVLSLPGGISSYLRAQSTTSYDEQGRVYRTDTYDVNPSTGAVGANTLYALTWYDARGHVIETQAPGGLVTKDTYDGTGRKTAEYQTDGAGGTSYAAASSVASDNVLTQILYTYDGNGNLIEAVTSDRFDSATGTGALGTPATGVNARVSYVAYYYDLADRRVATVDVGTNGGTAWARPSGVPTGSSTVLVTSTSYSTDAVQDITLTGNPTGGTFTLTFGGQTTGAIAYNATAATVQAALQALSSIGSGNVAVTAAPSGTGWEVRFTGAMANSYEGAIIGNGASLTGGTSQVVAVATVSAGGDAGYASIVTDPLGEVSRTYTDAEGRTVRTVQDFTNGVVTGTSNATTGYTYNQVGVTSVTAYQSGGGVQVTAYAYGVTTGTGSAINSNDIVGITEYPDGTSGIASSAQEVTTTVNALGQTLTLTDRNGTMHTCTYDVLGRQVSDAVTTLGSGVDGSVRLITTAYDGLGHAYLVTSYSAVSGGTVVNQVQRVYNGLGQLLADYQSASGAVNTSTTPVVQYAYAEMAGGVNNSRLTSITYPDGYVLTYNYSSGINNTISRLSSLSDTMGALEAYKYLGLSGVVERDHPQTNVNQTLITGGTGAAGDKYVGLDAFGRVVDDQWVNTGTSTITDEFQYGYDVDSNVLWRNNNTAAGAPFGELYTYTGENTLASFQRGTLNGTKTGLTGTASASQSFVTDGVGNFTSVTTNGTTQTRTANAQNEITGVSGATTPTYDHNGNMTGDQNGNTFVYDAWNRLVAVKNVSGTTLETFSYDGLGRRVTVTAGGTTTDLYYSAQGQVLEEQVGGAATVRYVWSPVYVNAMVLRDNATGSPGTLNQRLWVQQDANFNVTALVNGSGIVVERYVYSPYGVQTIYNAGYTSTLSSSAYGWVHGFQGMRFDSIAQQNESLGRFYSPALQTWTTMDPIGFGGGDVNLYRAVGNNPISRVDPSGEWFFVPVIVVGLVLLTPNGLDTSSQIENVAMVAVPLAIPRTVAVITISYLTLSADGHDNGQMQRIATAGGVILVGKAVVPALRWCKQQLTPGAAKPVVHIDIWGEGRYPGAINLNRTPITSTTGVPGRPIPNLTQYQGGRLPYADKTVDIVTLENAPIRPDTITEIARVIKPGGEVRLVGPKDVVEGLHKKIAEATGGKMYQTTIQNKEGIDMLYTNIVVPAG